MYPYNNDYQLRIDYNPQSNKYGFAKNVIGPQTWQSISVKDYTDTDANTIYVDKTGDDGNAGTAAAPKLTLLSAINACTSVKTKIVILDSGEYAEELDTMNNDYFVGLYADTGQTPVYTLRVLDFTPSNSNAIFVKKTGDDGDAGTQAAPKLTIAGAIAAVDGTHQAVVIMDSGTYAEDAFEFTGNFKKLVAANGMAPTIDVDLANANINLTSYLAITTYGSVAQQGIATGTLSTGKFVLAHATTPGGYINYYSSGGSLEKSVSFTSNQANEITLGIMSNDNIVVAYNDGTDGSKGKFVIYNSGGAAVVSPTTFETGGTENISPVGIMSNDSFVISYVDTGDSYYGKFVIYNSSGVLQAGPTTFSSSNTDFPKLGVFSNNNFVISYKDTGAGGMGKFAIYNSAGTLQIGPTTFDASTGIWVYGLGIQSTDNFVISFIDYIDSYKYKFIIYDSSGSLQVAATEFGDVSAGEFPFTGALCILKNDAFLVTYVTTDAGVPGKLKIYDSGGTGIYSATQFEATHPYNVSASLNDGGQLFIAYADNGDSDYGKYLIYNISYDGIKISTAAVINGIDILRSAEDYVHYLIKGNAAKLTAKWCKIEKSTNVNNNAYAIYSDSELDVQNCNISDNNIGIYSAENTATIKNNLIYRNSYGYGVHILGAAAASGDITITHNTIFNNYSGIRLETNHGANEIVKNNIISENDVYGINATTTITQSYSINTNTNNNVTNGTSVITANPLFINDGTLVPASTNLKLKLRVLGYFADSPAYLLGDDSAPDRDAGAWNVVPIGNATTWTSETIEKPAEGISVVYLPVGETQVIKKDGSIETYVDAWREQVELNFPGILTADFTGVLAMLMCNNNTMRLYPDPTTYPGNYNTYTLIYREVNGSPKNFRLSGTGKEDVRLIFSRAYQP